MGDADCDEVSNDLDNCALVSNVGQRDRDRNRVGDACDPFSGGPARVQVPPGGGAFSYTGENRDLGSLVGDAGGTVRSVWRWNNQSGSWDGFAMDLPDALKPDVMVGEGDVVFFISEDGFEFDLQ